MEIPFLDPALLGDGADALPLYRHVFHPDAPGLTFVGLMQSTGAAFPLVEAQARLVAAHLAGRYALPDPAAAARRLPGRAAGGHRPVGAAPARHAGRLRRATCASSAGS